MDEKAEPRPNYWLPIALAALACLALFYARAAGGMGLPSGVGAGLLAVACALGQARARRVLATNFLAALAVGVVGAPLAGLIPLPIGRAAGLFAAGAGLASFFALAVAWALDPAFRRLVRDLQAIRGGFKVPFIEKGAPGQIVERERAPRDEVPTARLQEEERQTYGIAIDPREPR